MYQFKGQHHGVDYQAQVFPGEAYTGWVAALSKEDTPLPDIEGRLLRNPVSDRNEPLAVRLAIHCGIKAELNLGGKEWPAESAPTLVAGCRVVPWLGARRCNMKDHVMFGDHISATVTDNNKTVGFTESMRDGRAAHVTQRDDGSLEHGFAGAPPTNETGTLETCRMLVLALNKAGGMWSQPEVTSALHTDAQCIRTDGQPDTLNIQVVRAQSNSKYWHEVSQTGGSEGCATPEQMADQLRDAISKKESRIPKDARPGLILVLSAVDSPAHAFDDVIEAFRNGHGEWASHLGFEQIWVVGPSLLLTHRVA